MIIDEDALHLEVCLFAVLLVLKLNECVLKTVSRSLVADDFTR